MKRILFFVMLLGALFTADATNYNAKQEALISGIEKNLKSLNYSVERVDDGLKFRSEGVTYYIEVDKDETNPMYLRLCRYVKFDDKIKRDQLMRKINDLNTIFAVKTYCKEKNVVLAAEMFLTSAAQFNNAFKDLMSLIKTAYQKIEQ